MDATITRRSILEEAEKLYAEHGFEGMSMRTLTQNAGVNLAAVNYHFGSKRELVMPMPHARIISMNEDRLELLADARQAASGGQAPSLEADLDAFLRPVARRAQKGGRPDVHFLRMVGRAISESEDFWEELFIRNFQELSETFMAALSQAAPDLPPSEIRWRFHFTVGSMLGALVKHGQFSRRSRDLPDANNIDVMFRRLRDFLCAGFRAPMSGGGAP